MNNKILYIFLTAFFNVLTANSSDRIVLSCTGDSENNFNAPFYFNFNHDAKDKTYVRFGVEGLILETEPSYSVKSESWKKIGNDCKINLNIEEKMIGTVLNTYNPSLSFNSSDSTFKIENLKHFKNATCTLKDIEFLNYLKQCSPNATGPNSEILSFSKSDDGCPKGYTEKNGFTRLYIGKVAETISNKIKDGKSNASSVTCHEDQFLLCTCMTNGGKKYLWERSKQASEKNSWLGFPTNPYFSAQ